MGMEVRRAKPHSSDDRRPALNVRLQMIHCNNSGWCKTPRCTCRKHGLECISACGHCQHGNCDNMANEPVTEENDEQNGI